LTYCPEGKGLASPLMLPGSTAFFFRPRNYPAFLVQHSSWTAFCLEAVDNPFMPMYFTICQGIYSHLVIPFFADSCPAPYSLHLTEFLTLVRKSAINPFDSSFGFGCTLDIALFSPISSWRFGHRRGSALPRLLCFLVIPSPYFCSSATQGRFWQRAVLPSRHTPASILRHSFVPFSFRDSSNTPIQSPGSRRPLNGPSNFVHAAKRSR